MSLFVRSGAPYSTSERKPHSTCSKGSSKESFLQPRGESQGVEAGGAKVWVEERRSRSRSHTCALTGGVVRWGLGRGVPVRRLLYVGQARTTLGLPRLSPGSSRPCRPHRGRERVRGTCRERDF